MHLSLAIYHLKVSMFTRARAIVASNHHLKIVAARASAPSRFKTRSAGFYPDIGADLDERRSGGDPRLRDAAIPLIHLRIQAERAQPSCGPRDNAECHRGYLYTADYKHADSQHDQQTLHRQCTEV